MANILDFTKKGESYNRFGIRITFKDGDQKEVECTYFGTSIDNPALMIFSNLSPYDEEISGDIPELFLNISEIKMIERIWIKRVTDEVSE